MLKYDTYDITFRELPNEVTLTFSISNCPNNCSGCHSPHLREDIGRDLGGVKKILPKYLDHITSVCFLGHGHPEKHKPQFLGILHYISETYPDLKIGLYSGLDDMIDEFKPYLHYYKVGPYIEELGGLDSPETTNQVLHALKN